MPPERPAPASLPSPLGELRSPIPPDSRLPIPWSDAMRTTTRTMKLPVPTLLLPAMLLLGCGEDEARGGGVGFQIDRGDATGKPLVRSAELTSLEMVGTDSAYLLHPVRVSLSVGVDGDPFDTDVVVGLATAEGDRGCLLGALRLEHAAGGFGQEEAFAEFDVPSTCSALAGRSDLELFASFDPWGGLDYERTLEVEDEPYDASEAASLYALMRVSMLEPGACVGCGAPVRLLESPGRDAELRELNLDSTVAILSIPEEGQTLAEVDVPHWTVSSRLRMMGVAKNEPLEPGEAVMSYQLRPLPGGAGYAELSEADRQWAPLVTRDRDLAADGWPQGGVEYQQRDPLDITGPAELNRVSPLFIANEVEDQLVFGAWQGVEEFELMTCVETSFEEAVFAGDAGPRDNNCAVMSVVVLRQYLGAEGDGSPTSMAGEEKARAAKLWDIDWSTRNARLGRTGVDFETWLEVNAAQQATTTYGGRSLSGAGSWFEAGARSTAEVFDFSTTLLDLYATFAGYQTGGGKVAMGASMLGFDFIDAIDIDTADGVTVTLQDIFDEADLDIDPRLSQDVVLTGYSFDDGCATVEAAIKAVGTIGIDTEQTRVSMRGLASGAQVTGTFAPFAEISAVSSVENAYEGWIGGGIAVTVVLLNATVPFTASASVVFAETGHELVIEEVAELVLTTLSGDITYSLQWDVCKWWSLFKCRGTHEHTLLEWDGISDSYRLFSAEQTIPFGG